MKPKAATFMELTARFNPEVYDNILKICRPCFVNQSIIPQIHEVITSKFPELDKTDTSILFAATVYKAFAPATLLGSGIERAPNGIREKMCELMQWNDAPVVNYYQDIARSYVKGAAALEFNKKIDITLSDESIAKFSVEDKQIKLF